MPDGKQEVSADEYRHLSQSPVVTDLRWNNEQWNFAISDGDYLTAYKQDGDKFFSQQTDIANPRLWVDRIAMGMASRER